MAKYSRLLWTVAGRVLRDAPEQDIEECVADAFIYLWQHPERYDPVRGSLRSWLSIIVKSRAVDRGRQSARRQELALREELMEETAAWESSEDPYAEAELDTLLEGLDEKDREIFRRRYRFNEKPREIALALNLPVKQVQNRLYRGKQRLREKLESTKEEIG